ncbi:MAG TPA: hypothetical protein VLI39_06990 [Sedimentisphaerales bacterium]|nr:hypothetical protein [Sedimentisphaerales bacterium]
MVKIVAWEVLVAAFTVCGGAGGGISVQGAVVTYPAPAAPASLPVSTCPARSWSA